MHNSLLPEVMEYVKALNDGRIWTSKDVYYITVPADPTSKLRKCVIVLEKSFGRWDISVDKNYQLIE